MQASSAGQTVEHVIRAMVMRSSTTGKGLITDAILTSRNALA